MREAAFSGSAFRFNVDFPLRLAAVKAVSASLYAAKQSPESMVPVQSLKCTFLFTILDNLPLT
jgi:hypothetical protein